MNTHAMYEWWDEEVLHAANEIGADLTFGEHTSSRHQQFWVTAHLLIVETETPEHGHALHTVEPDFDRKRPGDRAG